MKAAVYYSTGGPEVFRYEEVADPVIRDNGVLIQVGAVGIQGGDVLNRQGGALASNPHIVGYQVGGVVIATGPKVTTLQVGQKVAATMAFGSHAELVSVPETSAFAVPDSMSVHDAAGIPIEFGTADDCLFEFGGLQAGETVLIQAGASGVGLAAIQLAKQAGASMVLATASSDDRLERLREYGLDHGINYLNRVINCNFCDTCERNRYFDIGLSESYSTCSCCHHCFSQHDRRLSDDHGFWIKRKRFCEFLMLSNSHCQCV